MPTIITAAVGEKSMGKPAPNKPDDVRKIQALLKKVLDKDCPAFKDGVCDPAMIGAIKQFQRIWGVVNPDGTVDPGHHTWNTLKRLDRLAAPIELQQITPKRVLEGGYKITARTVDGGPLPPKGSGYTLHLIVQNDQNLIDVTGNSLVNLMTKDKFVDLLNILEKLRLWAVPVFCRLQLRYKGFVVSTSATPQMLSTPVQPHNKKFVPLDEKNNGPLVGYVKCGGRMFAEIEGYSKLLFVSPGRDTPDGLGRDGVPETNQNFRVLDCTTYVGAACRASNLCMDGDSDKLAKNLKATSCEAQCKTKDSKGNDVTKTVPLEHAAPEDVKAFLTNDTKGNFLVWWKKGTDGHIVLVVDGTVYEFAESQDGYNRSEVELWLKPYNKQELTVRRLPVPPARAS